MAYALMNTFGTKNGGHLYVRHVHDRASHGSSRALGIVCGLRPWLNTAVRDHRFRLDRVGFPV
jgi:hypothetical protein